MDYITITYNYNNVFHSELKLARVVPLLKSSGSNKITNFRPISVLTFFSQIFEKVMYNHFLNSNRRLYPHQFGFRHGHTTQQAIITVEIFILPGQSLVLGVVFLLGKTFDTVNNQILLKIYLYGIRGHILKWFESYLSDRSQYVTYGGIQSKIISVKCGVSHGSILGPLLFIIYMNDICNVSDLLYTILYADDTSILLNDNFVLMDIINNELQKMYNIWLRANKLTLNIDKTYYIMFHRARIKNKDFALGIFYK